MADKCRWCAGTGLYYPLVGAPESCRECQNPVPVKMAREYDLRDAYYIWSLSPILQVGCIPDEMGIREGLQELAAKADGGDYRILCETFYNIHLHETIRVIYAIPVNREPPKRIVAK